MRKLLLIMLPAALVFNAFGQEKYKYKKSPTLVAHFGMFDFKTAEAIRNSSVGSVISNDKWTKLKEMNGALGLSFINGINNHLDYSVNGFLTTVAYPYRDDSRQPKSDYMLGEFDASAHLKLLTDNYFLVPYVSAGVGGSIYKDARMDAFMPLGAGLQFRLAEGTFAFSNFQYRVPITQRANYHFVYTLGVGTAITKKKEPEVKQVPPPPPPPPPPPADTDGDGIFDKDDKCPNEKGVAKYNGCPVPDSDKDGINDDEDKCPTVAGIARYQGCPIPDTDKDGINDEEDKCPSVAGIARYQGCPIPDTDGDGINDEEDKCKDTPGLADNKGCPEMIFYYKRNDALLSAAEKADLDKLVEWMNRHPELSVSIEGHTSTPGTAEYNQKLSEKRAQNTVKYLVSKGIDKNRLKAVGHGEKFPIGDNTKESGRAASRRVVMRIAD